MTCEDLLIHTARPMGRLGQMRAPGVALCLLGGVLAWSGPAAAASPSEKLVGEVAAGSRIESAPTTAGFSEGTPEATAESSRSMVETSPEAPIAVDRSSVTEVRKPADPPHSKRSRLVRVIGLGAIIAGVAVAACHAGFLM